MPKQLVVLIREDPATSHRASEAIRIALGLSTGPNPITIILLNNARQLVSDDAYALPDGDILETHLPVIKNLEIPIILPIGSRDLLPIDDEFTIQESSSWQMAELIEQADRVLAF